MLRFYHVLTRFFLILANFSLALLLFTHLISSAVDLCSLLEKIEQETWRETGISFVTSVTRLVERLLDYRCAEMLRHVRSRSGKAPSCLVTRTAGHVAAVQAH